MEQISQHLKQVIAECYPQYSGEIELSLAKNITFGDLSSSVAFAIASQTKEAPQSVANRLCPLLANRLSEVAEISVGSGTPYLNFKINPQIWRQILLRVDTDFDALTQPTEIKNERVLIEFISANPTGPLTLANGRGGYSGDALANVFEYAGASVDREYYFNDSGNQIMELGRSILAARDKVEIEGGYKGDYVAQLAQKVTTADPYQAGQEAAAAIFENWIIPMINRMGVRFDRFTSEQNLIDSGKVELIRQLLENDGKLYEKEGALWLRTMDYGDDKDRVMRRTDGTYTYLMKDIAYHYDKITRGYTTLITIVGADHFSEAKTLDMVISQIIAPTLGWHGSFYQPIIQFVRVTKGGVEVKMSKRAGTFMTIDDLLDEINSDVARFFFLTRSLESHMDFDLDLAKDASDQNPVYYVQYAYVRAKHILDKIALSDTDTTINAVELSDSERQIVLHLIEFPRLIDRVIATREVHKLTYYAMELAGLFHGFYASHPVIGADTSHKGKRVAITKYSYKILGIVLKLIGVTQPDKMVIST